MSKIMLVEDDNNLREIYEARLKAEGYDVVTAKDGEEALATAVKEKPDLFIADIMMPKISGFDMLDILRTTPETKNAKVIMMTALSQAEDKNRATQLGADRYLVKSQVTLEDVVSTVHELLEGKAPAKAEPTTAAPEAGMPVQAAQATPAAETPPADAMPAPTNPEPAEPSAAPAEANPTEMPAAMPEKAEETAAVAQPANDQSAAVENQIQDFISSQQTNVAAPTPDPSTDPMATTVAPDQPVPTDNTPPTTSIPVTTDEPASDDTAATTTMPTDETATTPDAATPPTPEMSSGHTKVIEPITDTPQVDTAAEPAAPTEASAQTPGETIEPDKPAEDQPAEPANPPVLS